MRLARAVARTPTSDPTVFDTLIDDLGRWLADEYDTWHGVKVPRP